MALGGLDPSGRPYPYFYKGLLRFDPSVPRPGGRVTRPVRVPKIIVKTASAELLNFEPSNFWDLQSPCLSGQASE